MKKKTIIILFVLGFLLLNSVLFVEADSGWDNGYGGGGYSDYGSYDSGSSDYGGSSYGTGGSSGGGIFHLIVAPVVLVAGLLVRAVSPKNKPRHVPIPENNNDVENQIIEMGMEREHKETIELLDNNYDSVIQKYLPHYTEEKLLKEVYDDFVMIQEAWMNFDYDTLKKYCSDELFEAYHSDLEVLKKDHGQNIMKDFQLVSSNVRNIEEHNGRVVIDIYLCASFYDYVINTDTGEVTRGEKDTLCKMPYDLEFIYDMEDAHICPNCGAEMTDRECSFCHTIVSERRGRLVLNKKGLMKY